MVSAIVTADENWGIGVDGKLPFTSDEILRQYRQLTYNRTLVMGHKTYQRNLRYYDKTNSIILLSHTLTSTVQEHETLVTPKTLKDTKKLLINNKNSATQYFVVGGIQTYKWLLPYCQKVYLAKVYRTFENTDGYFVNLDHDSNWELDDIERLNITSNTQYRFCIYIRRGGK